MINEPEPSKGDYHDGLAVTWDDRYSSGSFKRRSDFFASSILPKVPAGGKWLDAGCGSGFFSRLLARNGAMVTGVDRSPGMIEQAMMHAARAGLGDRADFATIATIKSLPFSAATFDGCISLSVLEYVDSPMNCLDELTRVLKPGAFLILSVPHAYSVVRLTQRISRLVRPSDAKRFDYLSVSRFAMTFWSLREALAGRGFATLQMVGFDAVLPKALQGICPPSLIFAVARKQMEAG